MTGKERVKAILEGKECDHLPIQPMVMTFAAKHTGITLLFARRSMIGDKACRKD